MSTMPAAAKLDGLLDETGAFSMLAIDQRESLRTMMSAGRDEPVADEAIVDFKVAAAQALSPYASAVLLDRLYGLPAAAVSSAPLILAADVLHQVPGGPVTGAALDHDLTVEIIHQTGAAALKMLVPWLPHTRQQSIDLAFDFMDLAKRAGLPGIVEGVVRPDDIAEWSDTARNEAIVAAATDLATVDPDLYKAEVPSYGRGSDEVILATSQEVTAALRCPWVVLSSGVDPKDFPAAVKACRAGGASGFLAGRAVWADAFKADDPYAFLATEAPARLERIKQAAAQ